MQRRDGSAGNDEDLPTEGPAVTEQLSTTPVITIADGVHLPVVGFGTLVYLGVKAARK